MSDCHNTSRASSTVAQVAITLMFSSVPTMNAISSRKNSSSSTITILIMSTYPVIYRLQRGNPANSSQKIIGDRSINALMVSNISFIPVNFDRNS